jgi:hypothetical protein
MQETLQVLKQRAAQAFDVPVDTLALMRHGIEMMDELNGKCVSVASPAQQTRAEVLCS